MHKGFLTGEDHVSRDADTVLLRERATLVDIFHCHSVLLDPSFLTSACVHISIPVSQTPLVGAHDLLSSGELKLRTAKSFNGVMGVAIPATHGHNLISNIDTSYLLQRLSVGSTHTGRKTIRACTGKHLVLTDDVIGMGTSADMVSLLSGILY